MTEHAHHPGRRLSSESWSVYGPMVGLRSGPLCRVHMAQLDAWLARAYGELKAGRRIREALSIANAAVDVEMYPDRVEGAGEDDEPDEADDGGDE